MLEERKIVSLGIPDDIFDEVEEVTKAIFEYNNLKKLRWDEVYDDVLTKMGKEDKIGNGRLLTFVVRRITEYGYDICPKPFELKSFR